MRKQTVWKDKKAGRQRRSVIPVQNVALMLQTHLGNRGHVSTCIQFTKHLHWQSFTAVLASGQKPVFTSFTTRGQHSHSSELKEFFLTLKLCN